VDNWLLLIGIFTLVSLGILVDRFLVQNSMRSARENEWRYRSLFDKTNDIVFIVDTEKNIMRVNQQASDLLGYPADELIGKPYSIVVPFEEHGNVNENFALLEKEGMTPLFERTLVRKDGSRFQVEFNANVVRDEKGRLLYFQGLARDVTERKRLEEQLRISLEEMETLAMQDPLTGLLNRRAVTDHAEAEWHRAQREKKPLSLILIDLDNLKKINDTKGHLVGDQVLVELAKAIKASRRHYDWAGRWGGDEFMFVLPGANLVGAKEVAKRMRASYEKSQLISGIGQLASVSMGIACYSGRAGDQVDLDKLFERADRALYRAKERGRSRVEVYRD
jgi:diguanylate cyclase (GGDEF)-like protein/PAS domain S-box-containing protein